MTEPAGVGALAAVPAATANGSPLPLPPGAVAVRLYLPPATAITYTIAHNQPAAPPAATWTITATAALFHDEPLAAGQQIFATALTGAVLYRPL